VEQVTADRGIILERFLDEKAFAVFDDGVVRALTITF
jgi:hypothetical protein